MKPPRENGLGCASLDQAGDLSGMRAWLWPLALAGMIFVASSRGQVAAPDVPGFDKIAHFFVYGLLGTLLARVPAVARLRVPGVYAAILLASLYGITDEFHQSFTPGRSVEMADWAADTAGAALAVILYARWSWYRRLLEFGLASRSRVEIDSAVASDSA